LEDGAADAANGDNDDMVGQGLAPAADAEDADAENGKLKIENGKLEDGGGAANDSDDDENSESRIPNSEFEKLLKAERDKYLRLAAEYDNFRKRSAREREMTYNDARADAITGLLPIYDNLERALKMECVDEAFYKGIEMTMTALMEIFEGMGVAQITAVGEPFDPNRHNAVMTTENPDLGEKVVADEFQKGFILGERVIRFSNVVVAN